MLVAIGMCSELDIHALVSHRQVGERQVYALHRSRCFKWIGYQYTVYICHVCNHNVSSNIGYQNHTQQWKKLKVCKPT